MDVDVFVKNVKARCKVLNTTPTAACTESGAGKNLITNMKNKGTMPSLDKVKKLADFLQCSISDLTGEASVPTHDDPEVAEALAAFGDLTPGERAKVFGYIEGLKSQRK